MSALRDVWAWREPAVHAVLRLAIRTVHIGIGVALNRAAALRDDPAAKYRRNAARARPITFGRLRGAIRSPSVPLERPEWTT